MPTPRSLGDLLLWREVVDEESLAQAQEAARRLGIGLVPVLLRERLVGAREIFEIQREYLRIPDVDVEKVEVDNEALRAISVHFAEGHLVLPLAFDRGPNSIIQVAMADALDGEAIEEIERATASRVMPLLAPAPDILAAINRLYRTVVTQVMEHRVGIPLQKRKWPTTDETNAQSGGVRTQPGHALENETNLELRLRALMRVLIARGLITEEEYVEELRSLLREGDGEKYPR